MNASIETVAKIVPEVKMHSLEIKEMFERGRKATAKISNASRDITNVERWQAKKTLANVVKGLTAHFGSAPIPAQVEGYNEFAQWKVLTDKTIAEKVAEHTASLKNAFEQVVTHGTAFEEMSALSTPASNRGKAQSNLELSIKAMESAAAKAKNELGELLAGNKAEEILKNVGLEKRTNGNTVNDLTAWLTGYKELAADAVGARLKKVAAHISAVAPEAAESLTELQKEFRSFEDSLAHRNTKILAAQIPTLSQHVGNLQTALAKVTDESVLKTANACLADIKTRSQLAGQVIENAFGQRHGELVSMFETVAKRSEELSKLRGSKLESDIESIAHKEQLLAKLQTNFKSAFSEFSEFLASHNMKDRLTSLEKSFEDKKPGLLDSIRTFENVTVTEAAEQAAAFAKKIEENKGVRKAQDTITRPQSDGMMGWVKKLYDKGKINFTDRPPGELMFRQSAAYIGGFTTLSALIGGLYNNSRTPRNEEEEYQQNESNRYCLISGIAGIAMIAGAALVGGGKRAGLGM
jgi:hypothetical protein